jgi:D-alanyl-D-alanine carboxypeptidase
MNKKITVVSLAIFSLIIFLQNTAKPIAWLSPLPEKTDIFDTVKAKLDSRENSYKVNEEKSFSIIPVAEAADTLNNVHAYAVIDYDTGKVLAQNNMDAHVPIASLTKIMTAVVALDLANPDEEFTVTEKAAKVIPTKIGVVVGQKMTLRELLHAALLTSANDAVQVIEDGIDAKYGEPVFVRAMNEKAQFLKLTESHFMNPQGFDNAEHYSSAHDLAVLTHYAMQYPLISEIVKKDYEYLPADQNHKQFDLPNWQGLLGVYPGAEGVKIGNTDSALHTTVVLSQREGKTILAVVLGANNGLDRDLKAAELLDYGFGKYNIKPANITTEQLQAKYQTWNAILNKS